MADYQEYRRRILRKRWFRTFSVAGLLFLLVLVSVVGILWKRLHREQSPAAVQGPTIFQQELQGSEWNTVNYTPARRLAVQLSADGTTAMDFRLAALAESPAVDRSYFNDACFLGDSLTQGMQIYSTGLPEASFCAYKGIGPNAVVNSTTCTRRDGVKEIPMEVLTAQQPKVLYILLGTNVLNRDGDYSSFLTYYRLMLDMIAQALPNTQIYVQSITPVRPEVRASHPGLYKERLCEINDELSAIALEKGCVFLNLWEALADENGDLKAEYAQNDGYHVKPEGYTAWVDYLRTHTINPGVTSAAARSTKKAAVPLFRTMTQQLSFCLKTGTGNGIGTVPHRLVFGRRGVLLHLSGQLPLSLPSACGCHEIDHLKYHSYPMYRIPHLLFFVKYFALTQKSSKAFRTDVPHRNNGIFIFLRVSGNLQSQNDLRCQFRCQDFLEHQCRVRTISPQNIIRFLQDLRKILEQPVIIARMPFFNMEDLLFCNDNIFR